MCTCLYMALCQFRMLTLLCTELATILHAQHAKAQDFLC